MKGNGCGCVPLSQIKSKEKVEIVDKYGTSEEMRRLSDMGLCNGVEVEIIVPGSRTVPFLIGVDGARIALEPSLADMLLVNRREFRHHGRHECRRSFFGGGFMRKRRGHGGNIDER